MKTKTLVLAAIMFLGLGAAAFAQSTFSVGSIPVTAVINTGVTEPSGAITFTMISVATSVDGTFTITYGVPITNLLTGATGVVVTSVPAGAAVNTTLSSNTNGVLVITVPALTTAVTVSNVRVAVAGTTLTSLAASITATGNAIVAGQTNVTVISSIAAGIASIGKSTSGVVNAVTGAPTTQPTVLVQEGFLNAWLLGSGIRLTATGLPPVGVTVKFPLLAGTDAVGSVWSQVSCTDFTVLTLGGAEVTISSTGSSPTQVCYKETIVGALADTTQEKLTISPVAAFAAGSDVPLPGATITFTASMAQIGTAFGTDGKVITVAPGNYIPRFIASEVGPATLLTIVGNKTILLLPFSQVVGSAGYDTGISIANTTTDPGKTALGFGTAPTKQAGTITFYFYPQATGGTVPASFTYTTGATTPGSGLNASGQVPSGSTYVVLLSQLLAAAGKTGDFNGYIFAIPGFTNAHGLYVLSNFSTFSQGSLMLSIQAPRDTFVVPGSTVAAGATVGAPFTEQVTF